MPDMNWGPIMRPLIKDKIEAAQEKQRRKKFASFDLPSTTHEWSDDQNYAYKGISDGLGVEPLKAEQYVNTHTPPSKPSGHANIFYPATEPTGFEQDLSRKLVDRHKPAGMKPDDGPPVQFASQSGHVLGDGEARKPELARAGTRPLFDEAAQVGRQVHYKEQADKIAGKAGYKDGKPINHLHLESQFAQQGTKSQTPKREQSRKDCLASVEGDCNFAVADNPKADGSRPWYEANVFSEVEKHKDAIAKIADANKVDPDLVRAIMQMETSQGYYDQLVSWFDGNDSILPMNVNTEYWGDTWGTRDQLKSPEKNIEAGVKMLKRIQERLPENQRNSIRHIATLYNNINAKSVNDYGARVEEIYNAKPWAKDKAK